MGNAGSSGSDLAGLELRVADDWPHDATQLSATFALVHFVLAGRSTLVPHDHRLASIESILTDKR